jgi:hypothetical protein
MAVGARSSSIIRSILRSISSSRPRISESLQASSQGKTPLINAFLLALLPAQQSGASLIPAGILAALANLDQGEFTEGGVACTSNLVPKSATSDGDKAKGPALPVAVFGEIPWQ